ncbi:hypothetical protein B0J14DRAFT_665896 [Halenospora varia]|nr:hypothetical protein B0J14DRAFT_665896 [Halenospora varia]
MSVPQTLDLDDLAHHSKSAIWEYPDEEPDVALRLYASGTRFLNCSSLTMMYPIDYTHDERDENDIRAGIYSRLLSFRTRDDHGEYEELRYVRTHIIDASCLRIDSRIFKLGVAMFYGANTFHFEMTGGLYYSSPPSIFGKERYFHRPSAVKPIRLNKLDKAAAHAITQIRGQVPPTELLDPQNAGALKSLRSSGEFRLILCGGGACDQHCRHNLWTTLHLYLSIILTLCTSLGKLSIYVWHDPEGEHRPNIIPRGTPTTLEEGLVPILNKIRGITSLRTLEVICTEGNPRGYVYCYGVEDILKFGSTPDFARPTIKWIAEQHDQDFKQYVAQLGMKKIVSGNDEHDSSVQCDFC